MARERDDDYDDRPRRPRDDDYDDRPRRRSRDDDDYDRPRQLTGLDAFFTNNFVMAIVLTVCCGFIGLIVNIIGATSCTDPTAKKNAKLLLYIQLGLIVFGLIVQGILLVAGVSVFNQIGK